MNLYPTWLMKAVQTDGIKSLTVGKVFAVTMMVFLPLYILNSWGVKPAFLMAVIIALGMFVIGFENGTFYVKKG